MVQHALSATTPEAVWKLKAQVAGQANRQAERIRQEANERAQSISVGSGLQPAARSDSGIDVF